MIPIAAIIIPFAAGASLSVGMHAGEALVAQVKRLKPKIQRRLELKRKRLPAQIVIIEHGHKQP